MTKRLQHLNADNIKRLLTTSVIGKEVIYLKEIDSTNTYGLKLLQGDIVPDGTVIIANYQTSGKGRHGKYWETPKGKGLLFTVLFTDLHTIKIPQLLAFSGALSVAESILQLFPSHKPSIRWPNDILIRGKKVGGVLVETKKQSDSPGRLSAALGIGVNVNQSRNDFSPEIAEQAASLFMFTGKRVLRLELLVSILDNLERIYLFLEKGKDTGFWRRLKKLSSTIGKGLKVHTSGHSVIEGTAVDIEPDGALVVRLDNGELRPFYSGEVEEVEWVE